MRWKDVLERYWHLVDKDGNMHSVVYNQNLQTQGLSQGGEHLGISIN